jgi:hypothetical protein
MSKEGDTLKIMADIVNPANHHVSVYANINGDETIFKDSIQLFDNGLGVDSVADDNIFGGQKMYSGLHEDIFEITLRTTDIDKSFSYYLPNHAFFTTAGPIVWKDYVITQQNDSLYSMKVTLENQGLSYTVQGVSAQISTNDSNITNIAPTMNPQYYPDIEPGQSVQNNGTYGYVFYANSNPNIVNFTLDIYCDNIHYWPDTMKVDLVTDVETEIFNLPNEYKLSQNYPNPFNPSTTIRFGLPENGFVELTVYNVLGEKITTIISQELNAGYHSVEFDNSNLGSGIYFYQIISANFADIKKMVLIK